MSRASFNSRSRVGSDRARYGEAKDLAGFQFTLPCRERHRQDCDCHHFRVFQFTLPCRERLVAVAEVGAEVAFQFTLPCRERRVPRGIYL